MTQTRLQSSMKAAALTVLIIASLACAMPSRNPGVAQKQHPTGGADGILGLGRQRRLLATSKAPAVSDVYDLIIIGSGISGLAAASRAKARNVSRILILEARNRTGGRTYTVPLKISLPANAPVPAAIDLGAAWIHGYGTKANGLNPMVALAAKANMPVYNVTEAGLSFNPLGKEDPASWDTMSSNMYGSFEDYLASYQDGDLRELPPADSLSLEAVVNKFIQVKKLSSQQQLALKQALSTEVVLDYAGDLPDLSATHFNEDLDWGGPDALPGRGYGALANYLLTATPGLNPSSDVKLGHAVTSIDYSGVNASSSSSPPVVVNGTVLSATGGFTGGVPFSFKAKYVIVTMPLGYLQAQLKPTPPPTGALFKPPLPAAQTAAINALGMGLLNKVILVWNDNSWWRSLITTPWLTMRNETLLGAFSEYYNLAATPAKLPVIICFNGASFARSIEPLSDSETVKRALAPLQRLLPAGKTIPTPVQTLVTRWQSDPWTLGAYSYGKVGMTASTRGKAFAA
ncbi:hypothetical protein Agub_g12127, partial [Astrephomene gubernaculifera]